VRYLRRTSAVGRIFQQQRKISLGINRPRGWLRLECGGVLCRQHVRRRAPATLVMSEHWHQGPKGFGRSLRRGPGRALHGQHNTGGHSERARRSPRHPRDHAHAKWQPWVAPDCRRQPHHIGYCNYDGGTGGASGRKSYPMSLPKCGIFDRRKKRLCASLRPAKPEDWDRELCIQPSMVAIIGVVGTRAMDARSSQ
jgi:hypothetical protein